VGGFVKRYLITGSAGAGKSTLAGKLTASGYQAVEADTDLAVYIDATTEEIVDAGDLGPDEHWELGHLWAWDPDKLKRLLDDQTHTMLFICGVAARQERYYGLFDNVFVLHIKSDEELSRRLRRRWRQCDQAQIDVDVAQNAGMLEHAARYGLDLIDASEPIDEVQRRILQQCAAAPVRNA
jgi:adenylate kinase family enzyme